MRHLEPDHFHIVNGGSGQPSLTFLMPLYRQAPFVGDAIGSVLRQRGIHAEIIMSDDASDDATFEVALAAVTRWLQDTHCPHRILMRRSRQRLWRNHLGLLADRASCDILCQAHGDDLSHPDRGLVLTKVFGSAPAVAMLVGDAEIIETGDGMPAAWPSIAMPVAAGRYPLALAVEGDDLLTGFNMAWRKSALDRFPRLDHDHSAVAHDRIMALRAALCGDVARVAAPLVRRRVHAGAAHRREFHEPGTGGDFGWALTVLAQLDAMQRDGDHARASGLIGEARHAELNRIIAGLRQDRLALLLATFGKHTIAGRKIAWLDEAQMARLRSNAQPG